MRAVKARAEVTLYSDDLLTAFAIISSNVQHVEGKPVVASNMRLPGKKSADTYWVPVDEWSALVEKDQW